VSLVEKKSQIIYFQYNTSITIIKTYYQMRFVLEQKCKLIMLKKGARTILQ